MRGGKGTKFSGSVQIDEAYVVFVVMALVVPYKRGFLGTYLCIVSFPQSDFFPT